MRAAVGFGHNIRALNVYTDPDEVIRRVPLKFVVDGEVHYGWARVKLVSPGGYASGSISGYAYETVPNQPIVTGQTGGTADGNKQVSQAKPDSARILESGAQTLGMLAMGTPATSVWRSKTTADRLP